MEQITLTKEELKEIIAKEVREAIRGKKPSKTPYSHMVSLHYL